MFEQWIASAFSLQEEKLHPRHIQYNVKHVLCFQCFCRFEISDHLGYCRLTGKEVEAEFGRLLAEANESFRTSWQRSGSSTYSGAYAEILWHFGAFLGIGGALILTLSKQQALKPGQKVPKKTIGFHQNVIIFSSQIACHVETKQITPTEAVSKSLAWLHL